MPKPVGYRHSVAIVYGIYDGYIPVVAFVAVVYGTRPFIPYDDSSAC